MLCRNNAIVVLGEKIANRLYSLETTEPIELEDTHERLMFVLESSLLACAAIHVSAIGLRLALDKEEEADATADLFNKFVASANGKLKELTKIRSELN